MRLSPDTRLLACKLRLPLTHPAMRPARDPLYSLLYAAGDRAVAAVYVDGAKVVERGRVLTMDHQAAAALDEAQRRMMAEAPGRDWGRRSVDRLSPPCFPAG